MYYGFQLARKVINLKMLVIALLVLPTKLSAGNKGRSAVLLSSRLPFSAFA